MKFEGFCTYPHGYMTTLSLFFAVVGAFSATGYAFASCRFVVVDFNSRWGPLEDVLGAPTTGGNDFVNYRVAAGLFVWLNPRQSTQDFDVGACSGYRTTMLEALSEPKWEAVRFVAVISVLMGLMMVLWIFMITTLSMKRREIVMMSICFAILTTLVGCSFLIFQSSICNNVGEDTSCTLDEGGLVAIAAMILWCVALLVSCIFIKPVGQDLILVDGELRSDFEVRQYERKQKALERQEAKQARALTNVPYQKATESNKLKTPDAKRAEQEEPYNTPDTQMEMASQDSDDDQSGMELYLSNTLNKIEKICHDNDQRV